jgi:glutathione S-transferase
MKIYTSTRAPNPRRVDIFLAEKGIEVPRVEVDLNKLEHKQPEFMERNPLMRVPVLELDDGTVIAESIAICRYFEELYPEPPLFGVDTLDRALVEMWQRRVEHNFLYPVSMVFRHLHPGAAVLESPQLAEWGELNKPRVFEVLEWLDTELADRPFVAGDRYTVADISLLVGVDFMRPSKMRVPESCTNVLRWYGDVSSRPSARA